jgi:hypothetical protein
MQSPCRWHGIHQRRGAEAGSAAVVVFDEAAIECVKFRIGRGRITWMPLLLRRILDILRFAAFSRLSKADWSST